MLALCVESSHARGMGHLFRACRLARALAEAGEQVRFYVNDHAPSLEWLRRYGFSFSVAPVDMPDADWEAAAIARDHVRLWIYDKHFTDARATARIKTAGIPLVTFDDRGSGAADADLHVAALAFDPHETLGGRVLLRGEQYLLLDEELARFRRPRAAAGRPGKYIVTLGGADTYGVTPRIMRLLARHRRSATVVVGPAFSHFDALRAVTGGTFEVKQNVPSLAEEFDRHEVAITGGGMTPFEAAACGLPCIVVANEDFEVPVGRALAAFGGAVFAGHHAALDESVFARELPVDEMSRAALQRIDLEGVRRVVEAVRSL